MVINKLIVNNAHYMNEQEMKGIRGGVGLNEYCCVLYCLTGNNYNNNWSYGALDGALYGINNICISGGFGGYSGCNMSPGTCDYIGSN